MITRTNALLLKNALNKERGILDATAGRLLRAKAANNDKDVMIEEYIDAAAQQVAEASAITEKLIETLDTFLGR